MLLFPGMRAQRAGQQFMQSMFGGAMAFMVIAAVPGVASEANARVMQVCETWRDYYYNVETGEFIEWVGEPYQFCFDVTPSSRPRPPRGDYDGGFGTPRDPREHKCNKCHMAYSGCMGGVREGRDGCISHHYRQAHSWCIDVQRKKHGLLLEGEVECDVLEDADGKPFRECWGPGILECEASFAQDEPGSTVENTIKVNVGQDWFGVGADHTSTVTWGGSEGFLTACQKAESEAGQVCAANQKTCMDAAGGCQ